MPRRPADQKSRFRRRTNGPLGGRRRPSAASVLARSIAVSGTGGPIAPARPAGVIPIVRRGPGSRGTPAAVRSPVQGDPRPAVQPDDGTIAEPARANTATAAIPYLSRTGQGRARVGGAAAR